MTCSRRFGRKLQASSLALIGMLTVVGCGGSDTNTPPKKNDAGPDGGDISTNPAAVLKVDKVLVPFGTVDVGSKSAAPLPTVTVTNTSKTQIAALTPMVTGAGFAIEATTCAATLAPSASCIITLSFAPTTRGNASGSLVIATGLSVSLNGMGAEPGTFSVTDRVDLGQVAAGAAVPVAVRVTATAALTGLSCLGSGADLVADPASTTCTSAIAANTPCVFGFTFKSSTAGAKSDSVICAAGLTVKTVPVSATVVTPPAISISPTAATVTSTVGVPATTVLLVANSGGSTTGTLKATIAPATEFSVASECAVPLESLKTCKLTVTFTPTAGGTKTATVTVVDTTAATVTASATVTGVANMPSNLSLSGTADFGSVALGAAGTPVTFTMKNTGGLPAAAVTIASTEPQFKIASDTCTGTTLAATTGTCTFTVTFAPAAGSLPGLINGLLTANSDAGTPVSVAIKGTAITPPTLSISPNPLAFDGISLNTQSGDKVLTVTNTGAAATGAITVPAGLGNGFVISGNTCSASLAPAQTCTIAIRFTPSAIAQATFTITVTSASGSTGSATLTGTGRQPNVLEITPRDIGMATASCTTGQNCVAPTFSDTAIGQTNGSFPKKAKAAGIVFTVTNTNTASAGGINLESGPVTLTIGGTNATDFVMASTTCGPSLAPGQSCVYVVDFSPTAAGIRTAVLSATSTNGGNVATNMQAVGLPAIEMQACGYSPSAGVNPIAALVKHAPVQIAPTAGSDLKQKCINWLAGYTSASAQATGDDDLNKNDRTGLDFGQVSLGANCDPKNVKWFLVTVNSSTAADFKNLITATLTDAATPANFRIANGSGTDSCNNRNLDVSEGPAQCWISVQFMPQGTAKDAKTATVAATGASGGSASKSLTGTATGPLTINPATAEFGTVIVNEAGDTSVTLTINNWGNVALGKAAVEVSGAAAADFRKTFDSCTGTTPPANTSCSNDSACYVAYRFFPAAVGERSATFTVTAGTQTSTSTLHGVGVPETAITAAPAALAFGNVILSKKSDWQTITVTAGTGANETGTIEFALAGVNPEQYEIATDPTEFGTCGLTNTQRLGGSNPTSCTIKVRFVPRVADGLGAQPAVLQVTDPRDRTLTRKITLSGNGTSALSISPTSADFNQVAVTGPSGLLTFTVTNNGVVSIASPTVEIDSQFVQQFQSSGDCPNGTGSIAAGAACTIVVNLGTHETPGRIAINPAITVAGAASGNDANESKAVAQISATVETDPALQLVGLVGDGMSFSPTIDLGTAASATSGGNGGKVTLLYRNVGGHNTGALHYYFNHDLVEQTVNDVTTRTGTRYAIDTAAPDFAVVAPTSETDPDNCLSRFFQNGLPGGRFCKVQIQFKPTHTDVIPAVGFELVTELGTPPQSIAVVGDGLDPIADKLTVTPAFYNFGTGIGPVSAGLTMAATEAAAQDATAFTVTNGTNASVDLTITPSKATEVDSTADFYRVAAPTGKTECGASVAGNTTCFVWMKFLPRTGSATFRTGVLTVNGKNAGLIGKVREGTVLSVWEPTTGVNFGPVPRQLNSAAMPFTMMSIGDAPTTGSVTLAMAGTGTAAPTSLFTPSGCGTAAGALAAFNVESPSTMATCAGQVVLNPGNALIGNVVSESQTVKLEAQFAGLQANKAAKSDMTAQNGHSLQGICINQAALSTNPTNKQTFSTVQPVGTISSAVKTIVITNGAATSSLGVRDSQTTTKVSITLTEGSAPSTNFVLDLDPATVDSVRSCQKVADQITGDLILRGNESCLVAVKFAPQAMPTTGTTFSATLTASATTGGTATVAFEGTPRNELSVTLAGGAAPVENTYTFDAVQATKTGPENGIVFVIKNDGSTASGLLSTTLAGEFIIIEDECNGNSVAAGGTCEITLKFAPSSAGAKTGSLSVSGTPGGAATIALKGTGT